jgi:hypothetical protein
MQMPGSVPGVFLFQKSLLFSVNVKDQASLDAGICALVSSL